MRYKIGLLFLLLGPILLAQSPRDFLAENEIDQIREIQEPNERIALYLKFARLRLELVKQTLAVEKAGRSGLLHNNLEDYARIIEAIDTVIDDGLARKLDLQKGVALAVEKEKEFLALLNEFSAKQSKDRYLYEYVLKDAMEATEDSLEESQADLQARARRVLEQDASEKKKIESLRTPKDAAEGKAEQKKSEEKTRKAPTLRRKGEAPKETPKN